MKLLKITILVLLYIVLAPKGKCQNYIPYILPDSTEKEISKLIEKENWESIYMMLRSNLENSEYQLHINIIPEGNIENLHVHLQNLLQLSNRKILIKENFYPLLFFEDFIWGTTNTDLEGYGELGNRSAKIRRITFTGNSYVFYLDGYGNILRTSF